MLVPPGPLHRAGAYSVSSSKAHGDLAEARFLARVIDLGLIVSKPWSENAPYDFILDVAGRLTRVQVKSASVGNDGGYRIATASGRRSKHPYTAAHVDILAAYLIPENGWYLLPVSAFAPRKTIRFYPHRYPPHHFEKFREAWHLLGSTTVRRHRRMSLWAGLARIIHEWVEQAFRPA